MTTDKIIDLVVVCIYLVAVTVLGLYVGRKKSGSTEDYFLGGRKFTWLLIGFSLFATNIHMGFFIGWTGKAVRSGFAAFNLELLGGIMLTISALVFIPLCLRSRIYTVPQFLELRFNRASKVIFGGTYIIQSVLSSPIGIYTGALGVLSLFNWEVNQQNVIICGVVILLTVGLYAILGGLTSVVVTDMVQVFIMIGGGFLVAMIGLWKVGGFGPILEALPDNFELLRPHSDKEFPWSAVLTGQLLHSAFFAFTSIQILQRVLAAKDLHNAQCGMLLGAYLKLFGVVLFLIPGMVAAVLYAGVENTDTLYTTMVRDFLPVGLSGLVLAGMIAAMMSSQDSGINAQASVVALDIYPLVRPHASQREAVIVGKTFAATNMIWGVIAAPIFINLDTGLFDLAMTVVSFMIIPSGTVFLFGRFNKRLNGKGAVTTLLLGMFIGTYYVSCKNFPVLNDFMLPALRGMHFYHVFPLVFVLLTVVLFVVSYLTEPPVAEKLDCIRPIEPQLQEGPPRPWYCTFKFWWILYILIFIGFYVIF
ncbi:MAG: sodium/solute symporter [Verrucomicrobiae bacterium]|nr:sodium/solute symporter [Verrucomicrobiae bacterium]